MVVPTGATRLAAVIGSPVRHSLSPALHNAAFAALGLDWVYVALEVPSGQVPAALDGARGLGLAGLSVTMPHKEAAAAACDRLTDAAAMLGAVNCIVTEGDRLVGHNTDGPGFVAALAADGIEVGGRRCVVLGAGGAARAVSLALATAGADEVGVVNRTESRARDVVDLLGSKGRVVAASAVAATVRDADLIVNGTPIGMGRPGPDEMPLDPALLHDGQVVVDLIYEPRETPLLDAARQNGAVAVNGIPLLVHQAAIAFQLWTGVDAPVEVMTAAATRMP